MSKAIVHTCSGPTVNSFFCSCCCYFFCLFIMLCFFFFLLSAYLLMCTFKIVFFCFVFVFFFVCFFFFLEGSSFNSMWARWGGNLLLVGKNFSYFEVLKFWVWYNYLRISNVFYWFNVIFQIVHVCTCAGVSLFLCLCMNALLLASL